MFSSQSLFNTSLDESLNSDLEFSHIFVSLPSFSTDAFADAPLSNGSECKPFSHILYNSVYVDSYLSYVNNEFPFVSCCVGDSVYISVSSDLQMEYTMYCRKPVQIMAAEKRLSTCFTPSPVATKKIRPQYIFVKPTQTPPQSQISPSFALPSCTSTSSGEVTRSTSSRSSSLVSSSPSLTSVTSANFTVFTHIHDVETSVDKFYNVIQQSVTDVIHCLSTNDSKSAEVKLASIQDVLRHNRSDVHKRFASFRYHIRHAEDMLHSQLSDTVASRTELMCLTSSAGCSCVSSQPLSYGLSHNATTFTYICDIQGTVDKYCSLIQQSAANTVHYLAVSDSDSAFVELNCLSDVLCHYRLQLHKVCANFRTHLRRTENNLHCLSKSQP
jgi:hypothetical protein